MTNCSRHDTAQPAPDSSRQLGYQHGKASTMNIRRLSDEDTDAFRALRLFGLQDTPSAFGSSYEEEIAFPASAVEGWLALKPDRGTFGAFDKESLVGIVGLGRENMKNLSHKARVWGLYVRPEFRSKGIARALLLEALSLARSVPEIMQIGLCVNVKNTHAIQLYESVGFKEFGREPGAMRINGELHDEIHMYIPLSVT
jgi:ribosomal protein S18 acetylase RimI-like enzyme